MTRKALIRESDDVVENVIVAGEDYSPPDGYYTIDAQGRDCSPRDSYDPQNDEFIKADPRPASVAERVEKLESAAGVGEPGKKGIATRLDDLEDRIAALEEHHA